MNLTKPQLLTLQLYLEGELVRNERLLTVVNEALAALVVPEPPPPVTSPDGASLRVLLVVETTGADVKVRFGFDKNRNGRLAVLRHSETEYTYTPADTSGDWGAEGREHNQWVRNLAKGVPHAVFAQTTDEFDIWQNVGQSITVLIPEDTSPKTTDSQYPSSTMSAIKAPSSSAVAGDVGGTTMRSVSLFNERYNYSKAPAINADGTALYLRTVVRDLATGAKLLDLSKIVQSDCMPSLVDPDVFWGISGTWVVKGSLAKQSVEKIVSIGHECTIGHGEGSVTNDDRYLPVVRKDKRVLYVVDLRDRKVANTHEIGEGLNGFGISQDGAYLTWVLNDVLYSSNRYFSGIENTTLDSQHGDYGVDVNGDQVYLHFTTGDYFTILNLRTGERTRRFFGASTGGGHISCRNIKRQGWAYFSAYDGRLFSAKLDYENKLTYEDLGFHRHGSIDYNNYDYDAVPTVLPSQSGELVLFISTWLKTLPICVYCVSVKEHVVVKPTPVPAVTAWLPPTLKPAQEPLTLPTKRGEKVIEPTTGSIIECVSDKWGESHDYSISSPENADGTLLMLHNASTDTSDTGRNQDVIVHAETLELYRDKGYDLGANRRWAYTDPDVLYCLPNSVVLNGPTNIFKIYHPSDDTFETLHDFTVGQFAGYTMGFGQGGGTQDWDDHYMPISADNGKDSWMIVYDLKLRKIHSKIQWSKLLNRDAENIPAGHPRKGNAIPSSGEDSSFTMSRDGKYCVVFRGGYGDIPFHSMYEICRNDWTERRELGALSANGDWVTMHMSHAVTGVDSEGNQVLIGEQQPDQHHYITLDTPEIEFIRFPANAWGHTSNSPALQGYATAYGYGTAFKNPSFTGSIALRLCPLRKTSESPVFSGNDHGLPMYEGAPESEAMQYGYHRTDGTDYKSQPHFALTTLGDKGYFVSNQSGLPRGYRIMSPQ